jgi:mono/diheme cytochrome c family protein
MKPLHAAMTAFAVGTMLGQHASAAEPPAPVSSWTTTTVQAPPNAPQGYVPFQKYCSVCHGTGFGKPGTRALTAKYGGKVPATLEERTDLTADYIKLTVRHGVSVMPIFRKTEISDDELNAIAAYLTRKR